MKHQILRTNGNSYHLRLKADCNNTFTALGYGTLNQFSLDLGIQIIKFIDLIQLIRCQFFLTVAFTIPLMVYVRLISPVVRNMDIPFKERFCSCVC